MKMCRHCGSRRGHHANCRYAVRRPKKAAPVVDDEYLVIRALRMAADCTHREDLKPHYIRLAEERELIRKQALEAMK